MQQQKMKIPRLLLMEMNKISSSHIDLLLRCVLLLILTMTSSSVFSQFDKEIISVGERELSVGKVLKIAEQPKTIDSTFQFQELSYQILPRKTFSGFEPEHLKPAKINVKPKAPKLYKAYIKAGIGTFTTPLAELYYSSLRTRKGAYGIRYKHLSSNGGVKEAAHSGYSDNSIDLWGKGFFIKTRSRWWFWMEKRCKSFLWI